MTEEFSIGARYSLFQQKITVPNSASYPYYDCQPIPATTSCLANGEASVSIKEAVGKSVTSLVGLTFAYNTLDNPRDPTQGIFAEAKPEVAGLGGDSRFVRATAQLRAYYPITDDLTGMIRLQGGHMFGTGGDKLRVIDHFYQGPDLVRGFAPSGIGPRDRGGDANANAIGGTTYFGATAEIQFPIFGMPRELGLRGAIFADAGTLFGYRGKKFFDIDGNGVLNGTGPGCTAAAGVIQSECLDVRDDKTIRSSIGASLLWASPLGPIRFDYGYALTRAKGSGGDRLQAFRFSGGARF